MVSEAKASAISFLKKIMSGSKSFLRIFTSAFSLLITPSLFSAQTFEKYNPDFQTLRYVFLLPVNGK
jgi:hypothetical protein